MIYQPREEGQGLVEYALILVLVAVVVIVILALLGPAIGNIFSNLVKRLWSIVFVTKKETVSTVSFYFSLRGNLVLPWETLMLTVLTQN